MSARVNTGEIAPTLVSQTSDGRGGTAGPMQLVPPEPDARYWETRVARNGRGGKLDTVANTLKAEAGQTGIGDASPMVLITEPDEAQQRVWNVQPVSTTVGRNMLTAKPTGVAEALTSVGPQRRSDRGDLVQTYEVDRDRAHPNSESVKVREIDVAGTITADGDPTEKNDRGTRVVQRTAVRRLTPTECERLQGFPDGWTLVPELPKRGRRASA